MFTPDQVALLHEAFRIWSWTEQSEGRPFVPSTDKDAFKILAVRAVKFGALDGARSAWTRAARELEVEGVLKLCKPMVQGTPIPTDFQDQLNVLTPGQLRMKITPPANAARADQHDLRADRVRDHVAGGYDAQFADWFNRWSSGERPEGYAENEQTHLTAQQWRSLPPNVAAMKMHDPGFRAQVDRLIARGEI